MPDYRSGAGIALGLTMLGGGIGSMIAAKKRKKALEEFLKTFPEQQQPFAGKKISELAAVLGGVGQAMPIPEHMGQNALPFSMSPTLSPAQQQQLTPPSVINPQNAQLAKAKALIRSGLPQGIEMGMNMLLPQAGKQHAPMQVAPGNAIVDPNTGGIIYQAPPSKQESNKVITLAPGAKAYDYDGREIASNDGKEDEVGVVAIDPTDGKRHFFSRSYAIEKRLEAPEPSPGVTVNTGDITPAVKTDIQTKIAQSRVSERQLGRISTTWNPDWNYGEVQVWEAIKGGISKSKFADKTIGKFIPEESWDDYSKYIAWSRDVISMSNTHIHNMTGAQLSPGEVTRLLSELATRSDNARAYKAKLDATMAFLSDTREEYERMLLAGTPIEVVESTMADIIRNGISQIAGIPAEEELPPGVRPMP